MATRGTEGYLQDQIVRWLRGKGCFVMKCQVPPAPTGTADIFFCYEGFYGFIEVKQSNRATFRPLQLEFLEKMNEWSWAAAVYPGNWPDVQKELEQIL